MEDVETLRMTTVLQGRQMLLQPHVGPVSQLSPSLPTTNALVQAQDAPARNDAITPRRFSAGSSPDPVSVSDF